MREGDSQVPANPTTRLGKRGMSMTFAIVIMVVVIIIVGAGGYFGLQSVKSSSATTTSCSGAACAIKTTNDATLFVPYTPGYGQTMTKISAGLNLSATVGVKGSETIKSFAVAWGDGTTSTGATATFNHAYPSMGLYVISGNATDTSGAVHTGVGQLFPVNVTANIGDIEKGTYPTVTTYFNNGTTGGIYPWAAVGSTITVNGTYSRAPTNPFWSTGAPTLTPGSGVTSKSTSSGPDYASGTFTVNTPGIDTITFTGTTTNGTATLTFTYDWDVYVAASATGLGCAQCSSPTVKSPHPNSIVDYAIAPGGPVTIDPAGDYYTVGYQVDIQVIQTLITYNGTDVAPGPANYVPEVATCVPGTAQCTALYGNNLISGNNYTFVISSAAKFYDPSTGKSWPVYPSDVYFSFLRSMAFADLPAAAVYPGWIEAQALLGGAGSPAPNGPTGINASWDGGIHTPYNNTPQNMLGSMLVNDSSFCTSAMMTGSNNGCITFNVYGADQTWPAFYSYMAIPSAGGVTPCSWYSQQGATVPGFMGTSGGQKLATDTGCLLPGGVTTTSASAFQTWMASQAPTAWDSYEGLAVSNYPSPNPSVQWNAVGSGPYYIESLNPGVSVAYKANPTYVQPVACAGEVYCQPAPGSFASSVVNYWGDDDTVGIQELTAGYADFAGIEAAHTSTQLKLVQDGLAGVLNIPSLSTFNFAYNTAIDIASLKTYDPDPVNILANTLSYGGLRGFLNAAYPYSSVQSEYNVIQGVQQGFNYGGFIPEYMGNYYPTNISWPNYNVSNGVFSNPSASTSTVGSAGWYWSQLTNPSSGLYDPQFGSGGFSSSNQLHIPALFFEGDPTHQAILDLWGSFIYNLSGHAIVLDVFPVSSAIVYSNLLPDGQCPWALWFMGWAADYAQPYDYWAAYGAASSTWAAPDATFFTWTQPQYNNAACKYVGDPSSFAALTYYAGLTYIPDECQGVAYNVTLYWASAANHDLNLNEGVLEWNRVSAVYNLLNLYANTEQSNAIITYAPWINPGSLPTNLIDGLPGGIQLYWSITGNGVT